MRGKAETHSPKICMDKICAMCWYDDMWLFNSNGDASEFI